MNHAFQVINKIEEIIKSPGLELKESLALSSLPQDEAQIFLSSLKNSFEILKKLDIEYHKKFSKEELQKWQLIYIKIHDLFHQVIYKEKLTELELETTLSIFSENNLTVKNEDFEKLALAYFVLGVTALKNYHDSPYLISEKIILGEFISRGGCEESLWGLKCHHHMFVEVSKDLSQKLIKGTYTLLEKQYKNFVPTL